MYSYWLFPSILVKEASGETESLIGLRFPYLRDHRTVPLEGFD
jgi:hypothetical protein